MQLLIRNTTADPEAWRRTFDADREAQGNAGLSLLQLWHAAGDRHEIWALFEVSDTDKARTWVESAKAGLHDGRGAITGKDFHFLETA